MDGWMKALVATACVVVIAGGGYYAWSEHAAKKERESLADRRASFERCRSRMDDINNGRLSADDVTVLSNCILNGHITQADLDRASEARQRRLGG